MISLRASLAGLTIAALCSVTPVCPAAAAGEATVQVFGLQHRPAASMEGSIRRTATPQFTLLEFNAAPPLATNLAAPGNSLGAPQPALASADRGPGRAEAFKNCTTFAPPPMRSSLSRQASARRQLYWPIVRAAECRHGLPAGLLDALVLAESQYHTGATSWVGAGGLTQLMPATAISLGVSDRFNPVHNVEGGARYLSQMLTTFSGSVSLALAAYNAGPGAVKRSRGIPFNGETPSYVEKVLRYWRELANVDAASPMSARRVARLLGFLTPKGTTSAAVQIVASPLEEQ